MRDQLRRARLSPHCPGPVSSRARVWRPAVIYIFTSWRSAFPIPKTGQRHSLPRGYPEVTHRKRLAEQLPDAAQSAIGGYGAASPPASDLIVVITARTAGLGTSLKSVAEQQ